MARKHILIVEDQPQSAQVLRDGLESLNQDFSIELAASSGQALKMIDKQGPDLLVADVLLPGISGLELMQRVLERYPHTRVILVSGVRDSEMRKEVARAGAHAFFFKPLELADFLDAVERTLGLVESTLPSEMQLLKAQMDAAEEQVGNIAQYMTDLRFNLAAECVALLNERGQILARAGSLNDPEIETTLMPELMTAFFAAGRIAKHTGAPQTDGLMVFRNPEYHLHLSSIGQGYALLLVAQPLNSAQLAALSEATRKTLERMAPQLARLEHILRPDDEMELEAPAKAEAPSLEDTDPQLEGILHEAETKPMDRGHADKYWKSHTEQVLVAPPKGSALTYEQARQLGLAPVEEA